MNERPGDKRLKLVSQIEECQCACGFDRSHPEPCPVRIREGRCVHVWAALGGAATTYMVLPEAMLKSTLSHGAAGGTPE